MIINYKGRQLLITFTLLLSGLVSFFTGANQAVANDLDLPAFTAAAYAEEGGSMSLDVRGVDLRDVLSALAIKMGVSIILLETEPTEITFKVENTSPRTALELVIQRQGLAYVQEGSTVVVGQPDQLQRDFLNQMLLTRFDTYYVESEKIKSMITELGIQGIKSINIDTNPHLIWVQGTAQGLTEVRELITAVDVVDAKEKTFEEEQTRFVYQLTYIVAADAASRLQTFGFEGVKTIATDGDRYGHELMVICPKKVETQVKSALNSLDSPRKKTRAPILTAKGGNAHQALNSARDLLSQISGISAGNMNISRNLGSNQEAIHVLWAEETPDKIRLLRDLVEEMELESITSGSSDDDED